MAEFRLFVPMVSPATGASNEVYLALVEDFASQTLIHRRFQLQLFVQLVDAFSISGERLFLGYLAKNVLNRFRQDNGYGDGSYVKIWAGREDNEWLGEAMVGLNPSESALDSRLYDALTALYEVHAKS